MNRRTPGLLIALLVCPTADLLNAQPPASFNYGEALQKSIFFYEAQRSGRLPADNRVSWRGDSALNDGADNGVDLTGGWYDAGDHAKFGLPMASSATLLAWGALEYNAGYHSSEQIGPLLSNLKWATDYFLKASATPNELWGQVGDGDLDHSWWGPAEVLPMRRPSYKITATCPGSDLAGETAAALAAAAMLFRVEGSADYAQMLLDRAQSVYTFAETYQGKYSDCISNARGFYQSSHYLDELAWGAVWLYRATGDPGYLDKAIAYYARLPLEPGTQFKSFAWTHNWDDKSYGTAVLLAQITGQQEYRANVERWLDFWTTGYQGRRVRYTPGGLAWLDQWGSLRYAANTAFLALIYSDWMRAGSLDPERLSRYSTFAEGQIRYILGANPRNASYVIGFGNQPPRNPHHRTAHGSWADDINSPRDTVHTLYGALVGGPDAADAYTDSRSDYVKNEVADDYNAAFTGALAAMFQRYGRSPLDGFPGTETPSRDEMSVEAAINSQGANYIEIAAYAENMTAWPARATSHLALRYFFQIPSDNPADVSISTAFNECGTPSAPVRWVEKVYYIEIDCGVTYPGGQKVYRKQTQFRITSRITRDPAADWSLTGLASPSSGMVRSSFLPLYDDGRLVWGQAPPRGGAEPLAIVTPGELPAATAGSAYQISLRATGGTLPYAKWEIVDGSLPDPLVLDASSGKISGIPRSAGTVAFRVRVTDSAGVTAELGFTLKINPAPPLTIVTATLRPAYIGTAYASSLDASGGIAPYTWAIVSGTLPDGFSLSNNVISGTPAANVSVELTLEVTDSAGTKSQRAFTLNVAAAPATQGLKLLYRTNFVDTSSNQVGPQLKLANSGADSIPLAELTVRYYFTLETAQPLNLWCDYATLGCDNVKGKFVDNGPGGWYLEVSFSGAMQLAPGADSGEIQLRFAKSDWSNLDQSNDYSFDPTKRSSYAEWDHITVYRNGTLVWGVEPSIGK